LCRLGDLGVPVAFEPRERGIDLTVGDWFRPRKTPVVLAFEVVPVSRTSGEDS
jgi:hypothetical protein